MPASSRIMSSFRIVGEVSIASFPARHAWGSVSKMSRRGSLEMMRSSSSGMRKASLNCEHSPVDSSTVKGVFSRNANVCRRSIGSPSHEVDLSADSFVASAPVSESKLASIEILGMGQLGSIENFERGSSDSLIAFWILWFLVEGVE